MQHEDKAMHENMAVKLRHASHARRFALLPLLLLVLGAAKAAGPQCPGQVDAERQVDAILKTYTEGHRLKDAHLLTSPTMYFFDDSSPDHLVIFDVLPPFVDIGAKTLLEKNQKYVDVTTGPTIVWWTDKFVGADCSDADGSYAFFRGVMNIKDLHFKDGRTMNFSLRHTLVLKKFHGKFLIVHEHASVPDTAASLDAPKPAS